MAPIDRLIFCNPLVCTFEDEGSGFYCRAAGFIQSQMHCWMLGDAGGIRDARILPQPDLGVFSLFSAQTDVTSIISDDTKESTEGFSHWVLRHIPESCFLASSM